MLMDQDQQELITSALPRGQSSMKVVTEQDILDLLTQAASAPRKRINLNLHAAADDPINRFINAGIVGTYVRPHRHRIGRWELLSVLRGSVDVPIFTSEGELIDRWTLRADHMCLAEIPGGDWHTVIFHAPAAVILEVKPGPYEPHFDKEFAEWAPAEGDSIAALFLAWLKTAKHGDSWQQRDDLSTRRSTS
jgi:cupin fold WbuC family metalloprotein